LKEKEKKRRKEKKEEKKSVAGRVYCLPVEEDC
jgi:hypothetical protein